MSVNAKTIGIGLGGWLGGAFGLFLARITGCSDDDTFLMFVFCLVPCGILLGGGLGGRLTSLGRRCLSVGAGRFLPMPLKAFLTLNAAVSVLTVIALLNQFGGEAVVPPTDARFIAEFQHHKKDFDRLVAMTQRDKSVLYIGADFGVPRRPDVAELSPSDWEEYKRLLMKTGCRGGIGVNVDGDIFFDCWNRSAFMSRSVQKGMAYLRNPPESLRGELDSMPREEYGEGYRPVEGAWHLRYHAEPAD